MLRSLLEQLDWGQLAEFALKWTLQLYIQFLLNKTPHSITVITHKTITSGKWLGEYVHRVAFISADIYSPH